MESYLKKFYVSQEASNDFSKETRTCQFAYQKGKEPAHLFGTNVSGNNYPAISVLIEKQNHKTKPNK